MGIKLLCPKGHKLHVKSFLSGKKAICPKCGVHVTIPVVDSASADRSTTNDGAVSSDDGSDDLLLDAQFAPLEGVYTLGVPGQATQTLASPVASAGNGSPLAPPNSLTTSTPVSAVEKNAAGLQVDPIEAAPGSVWYVRPASGGQYGPASGEIMRDWITQGRVGTNSLVWRAGWTDWQNAATVFPQLGAQSIAPPVATAPAPLPVGSLVKSVSTAGVPVAQSLNIAPNAAPPAKAPFAATLRRRRDPNTSLIASLILGVIVLILVVVLVIVWQKSSPSPEPEVEKAAPASDVKPVPKSEEDSLLE